MSGLCARGPRQIIRAVPRFGRDLYVVDIFLMRLDRRHILERIRGEPAYLIDPAGCSAFSLQGLTTVFSLGKSEALVCELLINGFSNRGSPTCAMFHPSP